MSIFPNGLLELILYLAVFALAGLSFYMTMRVKFWKHEYEIAYRRADRLEWELNNVRNRWENLSEEFIKTLD